jgi:hypothetical protein
VLEVRVPRHRHDLAGRDADTARPFGQVPLAGLLRLNPGQRAPAALVAGDRRSGSGGVARAESFSPGTAASTSAKASVSWANCARATASSWTASRFFAENRAPTSLLPRLLKCIGEDLLTVNGPSSGMLRTPIAEEK